MKSATVRPAKLHGLAVQGAISLKSHVAMVLGLLCSIGLCLWLFGLFGNAFSRRDAVADRIRLVLARVEIINQSQSNRLAFVAMMKEAAFIHPFGRPDDVIRQLREDLALVLGAVKFDIAAIPGRALDGSPAPGELTSASVWILPVRLRLTAPDAGLIGFVKAIEDIRPGILIDTVSIRPRSIRGLQGSAEEPQVELTIDGAILIDHAAKATAP